MWAGILGHTRLFAAVTMLGNEELPCRSAKRATSASKTRHVRSFLRAHAPVMAAESDDLSDRGRSARAMIASRHGHSRT